MGRHGTTNWLLFYQTWMLTGSGVFRLEAGILLCPRHYSINLVSSNIFIYMYRYFFLFLSFGFCLVNAWMRAYIFGNKDHWFNVVYVYIVIRARVFIIWRKPCLYCCINKYLFIHTSCEEDMGGYEFYLIWYSALLWYRAFEFWQT